MSATPVRGLLGLLALGVCFGVAGRAVADPPDLERFSRQKQVEAQKAEAEVNRALADARRLEVSDPEKAIKILLKAKDRLQDSNALSDEQREELQTLLAARLKSAQATLRRQQEAENEERARAEAKHERERPLPTTGQKPSDQAKDYIGQRKDRLSASDSLGKRKAQGFLDVQHSIDVASIPTDRDVTFPKYWRELTKRRLKRFGVQLTKEEQNLIKALNSTMSVNFDKTAFRDVIAYLQEKTGTSIIVDKSALEEAQVDYDDPVEFTGKKLAFRTILRKVLADRGLAYILNKGIIEVVTPQKARETLVTRTYPIGGLLPITPGMPYGMKFAMARQAAAMIAEQIMGSTDPSIWKVNGGNATIDYNDATQSLIIRAPAEMHYTMSNLFTK
jgi:aromatic ring-cleaving dioxygenase